MKVCKKCKKKVANKAKICRYCGSDVTKCKIIPNPNKPAKQAPTKKTSAPKKPEIKKIEPKPQEEVKTNKSAKKQDLNSKKKMQTKKKQNKKEQLIKKERVIKLLKTIGQTILSFLKTIFIKVKAFIIKTPYFLKKAGIGILFVLKKILYGLKKLGSFIKFIAIKVGLFIKFIAIKTASFIKKASIKTGSLIKKGSIKIASIIKSFFIKLGQLVKKGIEKTKKQFSKIKAKREEKKKERKSKKEEQKEEKISKKTSEAEAKKQVKRSEKPSNYFTRIKNRISSAIKTDNTASKMIKRLAVCLVILGAVICFCYFGYVETPIDTNEIVVGEEATTKKIFAMGDIITYNGVNYKVANVETSEGNSYKAPQEGNTFLIVTIYIENNTNHKINYSYNNWTMSNSKEEETQRVFTSINVENALYSGKLDVGNTKRGSIVFEEPLKDKKLRLNFYNLKIDKNGVEYIDKSKRIFSVSIKIPEEQLTKKNN